jgi:hypothetical protein
VATDIITALVHAVNGAFPTRDAPVITGGDHRAPLDGSG